MNKQKIRAIGLIAGVTLAIAPLSPAFAASHYRGGHGGHYSGGHGGGHYYGYGWPVFGLAAAIVGTAAAIVTAPLAIAAA
ncbi:MAG: hypothetical protein ACXWBL_01310, partial [Usitatibacter sp.]